MLSCVWLFATHGLYSPWNSQSQNTGVGSLSLLQGIFPTQGSNPGLLHRRHILYQLSDQGSPNIIFGLMNKCTVFIFGHKERRKPNFIFCLRECTQNSLHETKKNVKVIYFFRINFPKLSCLKQQRFLNSQILRAGYFSIQVSWDSSQVIGQSSSSHSKS